MANGPIAKEAYPILDKKNMIIVPDILANSGGVTVSYFEWLQGIKNEKWTEKEVNKKLEKYMQKAFAPIWKTAQEKKVTLKQAAFIVAIDRIVNSGVRMS